jgi:hypothetical protein
MLKKIQKIQFFPVNLVMTNESCGKDLVIPSTRPLIFVEKGNIIIILFQSIIFYVLIYMKN